MTHLLFIIRKKSATVEKKEFRPTQGRIVRWEFIQDSRWITSQYPAKIVLHTHQSFENCLTHGHNNNTFAFVGKIRGGMLVLITLKIPENYCSRNTIIRINRNRKLIAFATPPQKARDAAFCSRATNSIGCWVLRRTLYPTKLLKGLTAELHSGFRELDQQHPRATLSAPTQEGEQKKKVFNKKMKPTAAIQLWLCGSRHAVLQSSLNNVLHFPVRWLTFAALKREPLRFSRSVSMILRLQKLGLFSLCILHSSVFEIYHELLPMTFLCASIPLRNSMLQFSSGAAILCLRNLQQTPTLNLHCQERACVGVVVNRRRLTCWNISLFNTLSNCRYTWKSARERYAIMVRRRKEMRG